MQHHCPRLGGKLRTADNLENDMNYTKPAGSDGSGNSPQAENSKSEPRLKGGAPTKGNESNGVSWGCWTKESQTEQLTNNRVSPHGSGGWKSKLREPAWAGSGGGGLLASHYILTGQPSSLCYEGANPPSELRFRERPTSKYLTSPCSFPAMRPRSHTSSHGG